jgi:CO dehydrogenase/acetyl-CoA synthase epsilon subunit
MFPVRHCYESGINTCVGSALGISVICIAQILAEAMRKASPQLMVLGHHIVDDEQVPTS